MDKVYTSADPGYLYPLRTGLPFPFLFPARRASQGLSIYTMMLRAARPISCHMTAIKTCSRTLQTLGLTHQTSPIALPIFGKR